MKILIVDDEVFSLEMMSRKLTQVGYSVTKANSVEVAKTLLSEGFDVVITDLHMPDGDGIDLLKWVRDSYPSVHRLILSAHTYEKDLEADIKSDLVTAALTKPVDIDAVLLPILEKIKE